MELLLRSSVCSLVWLCRMARRHLTTSSGFSYRDMRGASRVFILYLCLCAQGVIALGTGNVFSQSKNAFLPPDPQRALDSWSGALAIYETVEGTERIRASCHMKIGAALLGLGRYEDAITELEEASSMYRIIPGTENDQAKCDMYLSTALLEIGRFREYVEVTSRALTFLRSIPGAERLVARAYTMMGEGFLAGYEVAIARQEQALSIFRRISDAEEDQAKCYLDIGQLLWKIGEYEASIAKIEEALAIYQTIPDAGQRIAGCYCAIGVNLNELGRHREAIATLKRALLTYKTVLGVDSLGGQATCHMNTGVAFAYLDKHEEAVAQYEQALVIFQSIGENAPSEACCHANIGRSCLEMGLYERAVAELEDATRFGFNGSWIPRCLGEAYRLRGEPGDDQKAVKVFVKAADQAEEMRALVQAFSYRAGVFEEPAQVFSDFVGLLVELDWKKVLVEEPEVLRWSEQPASNRALLESAFHYAECGKGRALEDALRDKASLEDADTDVRLLGEDRGLSIRISKLASLREEWPSSDVERRNRLTQQIDELRQRRNMIEAELKHAVLGSYVAPEFRKPMEMGKELLARTAVLQYSVGEKEGWLLILTRKGVAAYRIGVLTPALPELLPRQQATVSQLIQAWQERPEKIGLEGLVQLARMRMEDLAKRASERHNLTDSAQERVILSQLGEVVLPDPAFEQLEQEGIHHLLVIPDGALHYVPFAMLRVPDGSGSREQYLIERYAVSYVPAMTILETIRKQAQERQLKRKMERYPVLAFANPSFREGIVPSSDDMVTRLRSVRGDYYSGSGLRLTVLPETEQEALRVASLFGTPEHHIQPVEMSESKALVCTRDAASEAVVKRWLGPSNDKTQWQYLLFSTHGLADTRNGMLSCLALSSPSSDSREDGFLQAQEIMGLKLDCDLVMLSACQTGLGRLRSGEGMVGLSAAFFYAGAESVCASLWQVPTGPTSQLTAEFFRNLKEGKLDKAEALRQAQLAVLRSDQHSPDRAIRYSDPFCWAAFVLTGEWR